MKYQTIDNTGKLIKIVPGEFMLQKYQSLGDYNYIEVMESSASIKQACAKVCNFIGYRIVRLSDGTQIDVRTTA